MFQLKRTSDKEISLRHHSDDPITSQEPDVMGFNWTIEEIFRTQRATAIFFRVARQSLCPELPLFFSAALAYENVGTVALPRCPLRR